ncbi:MULTISPECIES: DUF4397 domain-containing protein [Sutcliffiella]|uniref:DUF4397 domain-containing protein n=1 Tax=Sutcliffiella cohnii TaxID=33932 RepID=A0A223KR06_9BACI|nr:MULTISPECIES: DUF4397 domain-containing protein [Sutcliffiella]AST91753.1 hypothetical protein BC6307_10915 [Sutcliffiella cohnii]WBL12969.1 DUF4397 domain-containing protein [Sutcliffiella sp. NC1]
MLKRYHYSAYERYQPHYVPLYRTKNHANNLTSYVRFLNATPTSGSVDVYINDQQVLLEKMFKHSSHYIPLQEGEQKIDVYISNTNQLLASRMINIRKSNCYTLSLVGLEEFELLKKVDSLYTQPGESQLRFVHYSPLSPSIDVKVVYGDIIFPNLSYRETTQYLALTPMTVDLKIINTNTKEVIMELNRVNLRANASYTAIVIPPIENSNKVDIHFLSP